MTELTFSQLVLFALLANLPDVDMLASYALTGNVLSYHGGMTHTLAFAMLIAGVLVFAREWGNRVSGNKISGNRIFAYGLFVAAIFSHDLIDSLTGAELGWHATRGMPLFWPLYEDRMSSPLTLFPGPQHDSWDRLFNVHNLWVMLYEIVVFSPVLFWLSLRQFRQKS